MLFCSVSAPTSAAACSHWRTAEAVAAAQALTYCGKTCAKGSPSDRARSTP
jgi:hypothetical protein